MGQYWTLYNIDKGQRQKLGKLGEAFLNRDFQVLRRRLCHALPVRRQPLCELTRLCSPRHDEHMRLVLLVYPEPNLRPSLRRLLDDAPSAAHVKPEDADAQKYKTDSPGVGAPDHILTLPTELLSMIVRLVEDAFSVVCLSLTNSQLFHLGSKELLARVTRLESWAGDRIIAVGDYARLEDLPENVFTPEEVQMLTIAAEDPEEEEPESDWNDGFSEDSSNSLSLQSALDRRSDRSDDLNSKLFDATFWSAVEQMGLIWRPYVEQKKLLELIEIELEHERFLDPLNFPSTPWVLRNLTTGEFVRAEAVSHLASKRVPRPSRDSKKARTADGGKTVKIKPVDVDLGPFVGNTVTFGEVIATKICWSTDDSTAMSYDGELHRGSWAGHRLDLVPIETFPPRGDEKPWVDVSVATLQVMEDVWKSEFSQGGEDWRWFL